MPRNMAGIKRLPCGKFQGRVYIPKTKRSEKKRFRTAQEAYNWRLQRISELKKGGSRKRKKVPMLSEALEAFEEWAEGRREATSKWTHWVCNRLRRAEYLEQPLDEISPQDVARWVKDLRDDGLASRSIDHYVSWLKRLMTLHVEWKVLPHSPIEDVEPIGEHSNRVRYLSHEEEKALLIASPPRLRTVILFALLTGARKGEIQGMIWDKVNLERGLALVPAAQAKAKKDRWLYLPPKAVGLLDDLKKEREKKREEEKEKEKEGGSSGEKQEEREEVFPGLRGGRWWRLDKGFRAARSRAVEGNEGRKIEPCPSLADFHFHDLRHTYASRLVMAGIDLYRVKELLGHSDIRQTQRYAHLAPGGLSDAVKAVEGVLTVPFTVPSAPEPPKDGKG